MDMRYRICIINGAYPPLRDGIGDYTYKLIESLRKNDLPISLITSRIENISGSGDNFKIFPVIKKWNLFGVFLILRLINKYNFDIIHIQYPSSAYRKTVFFAALPFLIRVFFRKVKVIITLHEFSIAYPVNKVKQLLLAAFSHRIIVTAEGDFNELIRFPFCGQHKTEIIPIGNNINICLNGAGSREYFKEKGLIGSDTKIISFFGFIHPNKGIESLLEAVADLKREGFPVFLLLISGLDYAANKYHKQIGECIDRLSMAEFLHWTGYVDSGEVSRLLAISDICVLPFKDGVSLRRGTLVAALAHGLPVISTRGRNIPEELRHNENIYLVPRNDAESLSAAISELIKDGNLRQCIAGAAGKFSEGFSWKKISLAHTNLYQEVTESF